MSFVFNTHAWNFLISCLETNAWNVVAAGRSRSVGKRHKRTLAGETHLCAVALLDVIMCQLYSVRSVGPHEAASAAASV